VETAGADVRKAHAWKQLVLSRESNFNPQTKSLYQNRPTRGNDFRTGRAV
jgi:hypothetical protein